MDISIYLGDLSLIETSEEEYDLGLCTDINVRRALETPQTYIGEWALENSLTKVDNDFGNPVYLKRSEPLTLDWLTEVQLDVKKALSFLGEQVVVNYVNVSSSLNSVRVEVSYSLNNQTQLVDFEVPI